MPHVCRSSQYKLLLISGVSVRNGYMDNLYCSVKVFIEDFFWYLLFPLCHEPNLVPSSLGVSWYAFFQFYPNSSVKRFYLNYQEVQSAELNLWLNYSIFPWLFPSIIINSPISLHFISLFSYLNGFQLYWICAF